MKAPVSLLSIRAAPLRIDPVFLNSPLLENTALDRSLGCRAALKVEMNNPVGSFKGRGAELFAATALTQPSTLAAAPTTFAAMSAGAVTTRAANLAATRRAVVCASAGNFGQGLARAAARRDHACIVFAAETANPVKIQAIRNFGAEVKLVGADFDAAKQAAIGYAAKHGLRYVEDGAEPSIAEGAGTIGLELLAAEPSDVVLIQLGNGALLAGVATVLRDRAPQTRIIAVVAQNAPAMKLSIEAGRPMETSRADTIADGIAVRVPIPNTLGLLSTCCDEVVTVTENALLQAIRLVKRDLSLLLEPAGAAGIAYLLMQPERFRGQRVTTILSGGNISNELRAQLEAQ